MALAPPFPNLCCTFTPGIQNSDGSMVIQIGPLAAGFQVAVTSTVTVARTTVTVARPARGHPEPVPCQ